MIRLCLLGLIGLSAAMSAADPLTGVFARMDKAARGFKGMSADIENTVYTQPIDDKTVSSGTIKLRRNKADVRFLLELTEPATAARSVSFAGTELRTYNPIANYEQVIDVSTHKSDIEQAMMLGFGATSAEIKSTYDVSYVGPETVNGERASLIKLVPKSKEMLAQIREADLWISDALGVPIQQKFITPGGNYNLFSYSGLKLTPSLKDSELQFKPAKGVQINRVGAGKALK
jgi:outer membrane lipoprotein-sorting protein